MLWLGVLTTWGTVLKGCSIRMAEKHCLRLRKSHPTLQKLHLHSQASGQERGFTGYVQNWRVGILQVCSSLIFLYVCDLVWFSSLQRKEENTGGEPSTQWQRRTLSLQQCKEIRICMPWLVAAFFSKQQCLPFGLHSYCRELFVLPL